MIWKCTEWLNDIVQKPLYYLQSEQSQSSTTKKHEFVYITPIFGSTDSNMFPVFSRRTVKEMC